MTACQKENVPFASPTPNYWPNGPKFLCVANAAERIILVRKSTDPEWLQAVIDHPHSQRTVKLIADAQLRRLAKRNDQAHAPRI